MTKRLVADRRNASLRKTLTRSDLAVSIVVPAYNSCKTIGRTIESLLAQDFDYRYELIIVDDGSTDTTVQSLAPYKGSITLLHQRNRGAAIARHMGVRAASAPLIAFQDADDIALPHRLQTLFESLMSSDGCAVAGSLGRSKKIPGKILPRTFGFPTNGELRHIMNPAQLQIERGEPLFSAMNIVCHRNDALLSSSGRGFYKAANDYDLMLRLTKYGHFSVFQDVTLIYDDTVGGISAQQGAWGPCRTPAYSLLAADDFVRSTQSRRLHSEIRALVESRSSRVLVNLALNRWWNLFQRVLVVALRYHDLRDFPKTLAWGIESANKDFENEAPKILAAIAALVQRARNLRQ